VRSARSRHNWKTLPPSLNIEESPWDDPENTSGLYYSYLY